MLNVFPSALLKKWECSVKMMDSALTLTLKRRKTCCMKPRSDRDLKSVRKKTPGMIKMFANGILMASVASKNLNRILTFVSFGNSSKGTKISGSKINEF